MLSFFVITWLLIICIHSCMPVLPTPPALGQYFISNAQLLSDIIYPDSILLTIHKTAGPRGRPSIPSVPPSNTDLEPLCNIINLKTGSVGDAIPCSNYTTRFNRFYYTTSDVVIQQSSVIRQSSWCKIMNVKTGSVGDIVPCSDYINQTRNYATPDVIETTVSCKDDCNGMTATCIIGRKDILYKFDNVRYLANTTTCNSADIAPITSFTIINNGMTTTYISFATNMVGIEWYEVNMSPVGYIMYNVDREGDWSWIGNSLSLYSDVNIIKTWHYMLCERYPVAYIYSIITNRVAQSQIFSLKLTADGQVDAIKGRVLLLYGGGGSFLSISSYITVYDLTQRGHENSFQPNLCDFMAECSVEPCRDAQTSTYCPTVPYSICVNDYCGGCNARWYIMGHGDIDITWMC